jgi:hypothetical protein
MPILTGKTIGQLTQLTSAKEDMLFAVEYTGSTYHIPYSSITQSFGNKWYIPTGETITVKSDYQYFIYGNIINDGTLILESNSELVVVNGNFTNNGTFTNGGTLSVIEIPLFDTKVTGGTYSSGTITFTNNSGGTFTVTGIGSVNKYSTTLINPSGGTHTITHNLGTTDINVSLYLISTDDITTAQIKNRQNNSVDVVFTMPPGEDVRVVIIG